MSTTRLVAVAIVLIGAAIVSADEATDAFNQLYGDDLKRVLATPSVADDAVLAKQLLDAAKKVENQPEFLALLCEKAYELGAKDPSGYPTAQAALDVLAGAVPAKKVECLQKSVALAQKQYAAARGDAKTKTGESLIQALSTFAEAQAQAEDVDGASVTLRQALTLATSIKSESKAALQAQLDNLAPQHRVDKQVAALKAKLDANPKDTAARGELVRLCLIEMDDPSQAAKFVDESLDEATRKYVPAAAKPLDEAPELACKDLGEWYRGLADQAASPAGKGAMLQRARAYYERFLGLHTDQNLARTTAMLMVKKIDDAIEKLGAAGKREMAKGAEKADPRLAKWMVIFRSKNPAIWNKKVEGKGEMAVPLSECPKGIRYLRLTRMDTREYIVIPITWERLGRVDERVAKEPLYLWAGDASSRFNGLHLGVAKSPSRLELGLVVVLFRNDSEQFSGWGFGHVFQVNQKQGYSWDGKPIPETAFEIAVTARELTAEERKFFLQ